MSQEFYYIDKAGKPVGPIDTTTLKNHCLVGYIDKDTDIIVKGKKYKAASIKGLTFAEPTNESNTVEEETYYPNPFFAFFGTYLCASVAVLGGVFVIVRNIFNEMPTSEGYIIGSIVCGLGVLCFILAFISRRTTSLSLCSDSIVYRKGLLFRQTSTLTYSKVTVVDVQGDIFSLFTPVHSILLYTAASRKPAIRVNCIRNADKIRDMILSRVNHN